MEEKRDYLYSIYGKNTFLKIKPALGIGKILFAFVDRESKKSIDCYINLLDYEELLDEIKSRYLQKKIEVEKSKGEKYPKAIWETPLGGSTKKGRTIYRKFSISPGSSQYAVFAAECGPATNQDGMCVPNKKDNSNKDDFRIIRVGVMNYEEFRKMMLESEKYLRIWYERSRNDELYNELIQMMQRPSYDNSDDSSYDGNENPSENHPSPTIAEKEDAGADMPTVARDTFRAKNHIQKFNQGMYVYACRRTDEKPVPVIFLTDKIAEMEREKKEKWERLFRDLMDKTDVSFTISYQKKGDKLYFLNFA